MVADLPGELQAPTHQIRRRLVTVTLRRDVGKVVVGAERRRRLVVLQGNVERHTSEPQALDDATVGEHEDSLCVERLGENLGKQKRLGESKRRVDPLERKGMLARE